MKDVLHYLPDAETNETFAKVARPVLFVDPGLPQDRILKVLKENRTHLAIVRGEGDKKILGVVTMEDILEELVGDIQDDYGN